MLGPATLVVASGGQWKDPTTGEVQPKFHLHWRLARTAKCEDLKLLKEARKLAAVLVGADPTNVPAVHPIRWPGSWHHKGEPVLCSIDTAYPDREIDLVNALKILKVAAPKIKERDKPKTNGSTNPFEAYGNNQQWERPSDYIELMDKVRSGDDYRNAIVRLSARFIASGMSHRAVVALMEDLMNDPWKLKVTDGTRVFRTLNAP